MKIIIFLSFFLGSFILTAQKQSQEERFYSLSKTIEKASSNIGAEAMFKVQNQNFLSLNLSSIIKTKISTIEESFSLELNEVADTYEIPSKDGGFTVIVNLKSMTLITTTTIEHENLFHDELTKEELREEKNIWFNFKNEIDANRFSKLLNQVKN